MVPAPTFFLKSDKTPHESVLILSQVASHTVLGATYIHHRVATQMGCLARVGNVLWYEVSVLRGDSSWI